MTNKQDVERIEEKVRQAMYLTIERLSSRVAIRAAGNMIVPGGKSMKTHPTKLTTRTARLLRSVTGARGQEWEGNEGIKKVRKNKNSISIIVGTKVPYGAVHEYGYAGHTKLKTSKQNKLFWALYAKTGETKYKAMALSRGLTFKAYSGRPFLKPALEATEKETHEIFREAWQEVFS